MQDSPCQDATRGARRSAQRPARAVPIRLGPDHRRWIHITFALLWLSGALWLGYHYFAQVAGPFGPRPHPLEQWWLRLHGLATMLGLVTLGSVLVHHVRRAWEKRRNRLLGGALVAGFLWLAGTGYALYYFAAGSNQAWLAPMHWVPGLALPLVLVLHVRRARRRNKRRAPKGAEKTPFGQDGSGQLAVGSES